MSTNHKPTPAAKPSPLPRLHHSLPEPPLACAMSSGHHHQRGATNGARGQFGHTAHSQRRSDRTKPPIPDQTTSRASAHSGKQRWERDAPTAGQERLGSRPVGRDFVSGSASVSRGPSRQGQSPMAPNSFYGHSSATQYGGLQQQSMWGLQYDESRRPAGNSSHSHPSPASTSSGSTTSLRTPPDLLLNGNAIGQIYPNWKSTSPQHAVLSLNSWSGLAVRRPVAPRHMKKDEIAKRRRLLQSLPDDLLFTLPSPPHSPPQSPRPSSGRAERTQPELDDTRPHIRRADKSVDAPDVSSASCDSAADAHLRAAAIRAGKKRPRSEDDKSGDEVVPGRAASARPAHRRDHEPRRPSRGPSDSHDPEQEDGELSDSPPEDVDTSRQTADTGAQDGARASTDRQAAPLRIRAWTRDRLGKVANIYRTVGRARKHVGDQLAEKAALSMPSFSASGSSSNEVAALEQLDAVLLFCYAFYLSDQEKGAGSCLANNWFSLFGLLRYVTNAHSRSRNSGLVGLCRLVESSVLRILHGHEQHLLRGRVAAQQGSAVASPEALVSLSEGLLKLASDLDRSDRLALQASQHLSLGALKRNFPRTWAMIAETDDEDLLAEGSALRVDPGSWPKAESFAWPISSTTPIPHLVCFGRNLIREHAQNCGLDFEPVTIDTGL